MPACRVKATYRGSLSGYAVSRFFMRLMLTMKKNIVTGIVQARAIRISVRGLNPRIGSRCPETTPLTKFTTCVNGKIANATPSAAGE